MIRETIFALAIAVAGLAIVSGVWMISEPAGRITAGLLGAAWAWLVLSEAPNE